MADKLTQQIVDALSRVAAEPGGLPLYSSKADPGLFPNTAAAKPAAQKCLADELILAVASDPKAKAPRERYTLTEKGWAFLLAAVNPKQVLEDFVRVLEARQGEVGELLASARSMADSLQGLKDAVARVLPGVSAARVTVAGPHPPAPSPRGEGEKTSEASGRGAGEEEALGFPPLSPGRGGRGVRASEPVALLDAPPSLDLAPAVVAHLTEHPGPTDCTLPELFRALAQTRALTIGEFHDCLRQLHADGAITLPAWTGPLYELPEPQFALLIGHGIAYYASLKSGQWKVGSGQ